jgi:hypothetical protein
VALSRVDFWLSGLMALVALSVLDCLRASDMIAVWYVYWVWFG